MEILKIPLGLYQANCYLVKEGKDVLVIDPGARPERIQTFLGEDEKVIGILLTHGHFDHIGAVDALVNRYGCKVFIDEEDKMFLNDEKLNYSEKRNVKVFSPCISFKYGINKLGRFTFTVHSAPGHSKGSVLIEINNFLFTGDVLFKQSIGRTDLAGGSDSEMKQTLRWIKTLDPSFIVYPGHGDITTLAEELKTNIYLKK